MRETHGGVRQRTRTLSLSQKGLLVVGVPVAFQVILLLSLFAIEQAHDRDRAADRTSKEVVASNNRLLALLLDVESSKRGYALTGNPGFAEPYDRAVAQFSAELERLRTLVALTPETSDERHVAELERLARPILAYQRSSMEKIRAGHLDEVVASASQLVGKHLTDRFRDGMDRFLADERLLDAKRERSARRARNEITVALAGGGALSIALAGFLAIFFTRSITRRVRVVASNMERLERREPLQDPIEGQDDIAELDQRFHQMAAALEQAEKELERFFTVSLEMLCIAGFDGYFKRLNPVWEKTLGYSTAELCSRPFIDFVHPDDREATIAEAQGLAQGLETISFENRYHCADGSYRWLLWNAAGLPDARVIYAAATDITERKHSEDLLQDRNAALESANRELESFSYSVSHDLRAPLRAVSGYAGILEEDYAGVLDLEGRRLLEVVRSEAGRMGVLIDDLLAFSSLGRQSLAPVDLDLHVMANEIVDELGRNKPDREIEFVAGDIPPGRADRATIRQVLVNLLSNAVKYAKPAGTIRIEFGGSSDGDHNVYWVRDHGIGFDPRYAEKIFSVFQRLHTDAEFEGSGVGLAIVQRIMQRHGGRVWAESEPGKGAVFFFTLQMAGHQIPATGDNE